MNNNKKTEAESAKWISKKVFFASWFIILVVLSAGCRSIWQKPDMVIEKLALEKLSRVADLGAGRGFFTFRIAEALGPEGLIYPVEITSGQIDRLSRRADRLGMKNVVPVLATTTDASLPEKMDLIFLCNTYHHIENVTAYFSNLKKYLKSNGRIAIIDFDDLPWYLFALRSHQTSAETIKKEMDQAGYVFIEEHNNLPVQNFLIFGLP
jgi:arsenite methyltransferase